MNNILYTQNESPNQRNTIIIDGNLYSDLTSGIASDAFKSINKKSDEEGNKVWIIKKLIACGKIESKNFKFFKDSSGIFIKACFQEKDELGRNMPFMFYAKTTDTKEAYQILCDYASKIKRSCFEKELKFLTYLSNKYVYGGIGILTIITLLLSISFWKVANYIILWKAAN